VITADFVCGMERSSGTVIQVAGAGRTLRFGGGHVQARASLDINSGQSTDNPVFIAGIGIIQALIILPLAENSEVAPAYLPNIMQTRSQLSVVTATQSDTMDRVLWRHYFRLSFVNGPQICASTDCTERKIYQFLIGAKNAESGHDPFREARIRARATLDEKHALFWIRNIEWGGADFGTGFNLFFDNYLRFAVRAGR